MSVASGSMLLHYRLNEKIGEGGMGQVWKATDTTLGRDVAIKIIPAEFGTDRDRILRFEREAQVLASLSHPAIASIHGLHDSGGVRFLVMELVPGEDLAERLAGGAIPVGDALSIARQIAEALEAAHEQGVIHRDLKPANVKITPDGKAKLLDFGLAKAMDPMSSGAISRPNLMESPTLTARATLQGVILGTAAYMAPEQAAGAATDRRSDIWAFGVVLYEMLTGRRLFEGETISHVLAAVLKDEPDFSSLPPEVPPRIVGLMKACLRKKPRQRLQAIGDARVVIEEVLAGAGEDQPAASQPQPVRSHGLRPWHLAAGMILALFLGALATSALVRRTGSDRTIPRTLSELPLPKGTSAWSPALSPDGSKLAMVGRDSAEGSPRIWVRIVATGDLRPLPGTEGGGAPFWSPDGRSLGFFANKQLLRVDLEGGHPIRLVDTENFCGASWSQDTILFCGGRPPSIHRIPSTGGEAVTVLKPAGKESVLLPELLEGGRSFLYCTVTAAGEGKIHFASLDGAKNRDLAASDSKGVAAGSRLFYLRGTTLLARLFDAGSGELGGGDADIVAEGVDTWRGGQFTLAAGLLVFASQGATQGSRVTIYSRDGKTIDTIDSDTFLDDLILSPDGHRAAVMKASGAQGSSSETVDVWTIDLGRKLFSRATYGERDDDPVFSPDGAAIAFAHGGELYRKSLLASGDPQLLVETEADIVTNDWTKDGSVIYSDVDGSGEDLLAVPAAGGKPRRLTNTPFRESNGQVSPDGRWIAFVSNESGDVQVYLASWPSFEGRWRVSKESASMPRWRGDGRELYFLSKDNRLMRATIASGSPEPIISLPEELFRTRYQGSYTARASRWAVSPDGQRFLVLESLPGQEEDSAPMMLVTQPFGPARTTR